MGLHADLFWLLSLILGWKARQLTHCGQVLLRLLQWSTALLVLVRRWPLARVSEALLPGYTPRADPTEAVSKEDDGVLSARLKQMAR